MHLHFDIVKVSGKTTKQPVHTEIISITKKKSSLVENLYSNIQGKNGLSLL
jgi:hypothetical protein